MARLRKFRILQVRNKKCGHTYERASIKELIEQGKTTTIPAREDLFSRSLTIENVLMDSKRAQCGNDRDET